MIEVLYRIWANPAHTAQILHYELVCTARRQDDVLTGLLVNGARYEIKWANVERVRLVAA